MDETITRLLRDVTAGEGKIVALTGAGISAESGIPTFRGEEGFWKVGSRNYQPTELATQSAFGQLPREIWRWYLYRRTVCRRAEPNPGHEALVELERGMGDRFRLVTQNVDGLHLRAGHDLGRTFQIHGNIDYMRCAEGCCAELHEVPESIGAKDRDSELTDDEYALLRCPKCGELARPHVLWFDECYDEELFFAQSAMLAAADAAVLLVIGTSGATNLPMQMAALAVQRGTPIVDVNVERGVFSEFATRGERGAFVEGKAGEVLPDIVATLLG